MKIKDMQALQSDLQELVPEHAARLCELVKGDADPLDQEAVLRQAETCLFTLKAWELVMLAIADVVKDSLNRTVDTSEGGLVTFVHLTPTKVLAYHTSHDSFRVLSYRHLTGINWYG